MYYITQSALKAVLLASINAERGVRMKESVGSSFAGLGSVARGVALLEEHEGVDLNDWQQRVINDPIMRRTVGAALRGEIAEASIGAQDWINREFGMCEERAKCGLPVVEKRQVENAWRDGFGQHHHFLPGDLGRVQILEACQKAGIKIYNSSVAAADCNGDVLPTKAGVLEVNYGAVMVPTDREHRPFMLDYDQQCEWSNQQGGKGFTTAEESLMYILDMWIAIGRITYMGGSIRCKNASGSGYSLFVRWDADRGLRVYGFERDAQRWYLGAVPRKYTAIGA